MKIKNINMIKDCLENTDDSGRDKIKKLDKITPRSAKTILDAYEHLTTPALLSYLNKISKKSKK